MKNLRWFLVGCVVLSKTAMVSAETVSDDLRVVAERGGIKLTLQDIDTAMARIPEAERSAVIGGGDRLHKILDSELLSKQTAQRGREMKLMESPEVQRIIARVVDQELAKIALEQFVARAEKRDFNLLAKEYYTANPADFITPMTSVVQHVLVSKTGRTPAEVVERVNEVIEKARKGVSFDLLISQYSDDPSKSENAGTMAVSKAGVYVEEFEKAAHALKNPGDISTPVETEFGTHILRLVSRNLESTEPFEAVRETIMTQLEAEYLNGIRAKFYSDLRASNPIFHEDMIEVVRKRYGELPNISPAAQAVQGSK